MLRIHKFFTKWIFVQNWFWSEKILFFKLVKRFLFPSLLLNDRCGYIWRIYFYICFIWSKTISMTMVLNFIILFKVLIFFSLRTFIKSLYWFINFHCFWFLKLFIFKRTYIWMRKFHTLNKAFWWQSRWLIQKYLRLIL